MDRSVDSDVRQPDDWTPSRDPERHDSERAPIEQERQSLALLRERIDAAAKDNPTFAEFLDRLERSGVRAIPSVQRSGRLNGMTYELNGTRVRGSDLGRSYTAQGLQKTKGIRHGGELDQRRLEEAARLGREPITPLEQRSAVLRDRSLRIREQDGLSPAQRAAMREIGRFRTLSTSDFIRHQYRGDMQAWRQDAAALSRLGFIEQRSVVVTTHSKEHGRNIQTLSIVVLTKKGRNHSKRFDQDLKTSGQALYAGFVKPREIAHDAALYRMYQAEAKHIESQGGRIKRIVLDFELKKKAYSPLARARELSPPEYARKQAEIAEANGLKVIDGKIRLPDLRIEYETANGEAARVDLELATEHYRGEHMSAKGRAGFKIYAEGASFPPGGGPGGSPVWDDHDLEIFSF